MDTILRLENISVCYEDFTAVKNLSFQLDKGELGCLLGPSGCGKTSVLRAIAGFENICTGQIFLNGIQVSSKVYTLSPEKRKIGIVFQDNALFPHLTVIQNVMFGLYKLSSSEKKSRTEELLSMTGLIEEQDKYPHELSGGQQQRVALARALAPKPQLILMDEPFSNLDGELRERLGQDVKQILKETNTTAILVTHDQHEAFSIADKIGVMFEGEIMQWDNAYNLYHKPASKFVADFVGRGVILPGVISPNLLKLEVGEIRTLFPDDFNDGEEVDVLIRPDDVIHTETSQLKAEVISKAFQGSEVLYTLKLKSGRRLLSFIPSNHPHEVGEHIGIELDMNHIVVFRKD